MGAESKSAWHIVGVIALYWSVSISLVYLNKAIVSGDDDFSVPIFVTWCQCLVTCVICWIFGLLGEMERDRTAKEHGDKKTFLAGFPKASYASEVAWKVMPLSLIFVLMILSNQLTLKHVHVSFYNVARSLTIPFNAIFSVLILGSIVSLRTIGCLLVVIAGFYVGIEGEVTLSTVGVFWGIVSSVAVSLNSIYTKKALPHVENDAWRLTFTNNANACILFLPIVSYFEGATIMEHHSKIFTNAFLASLVLSGGLGFMMGFVSVMQIRATSPLTHNISGTAKAAAQSALAFYIWGNEATFGACLGIFLVLFGSTLYTYVKISEAQDKKPKAVPALPK